MTTPIDLSQLPAPNVVEALDYETILAERKARFIALHPEEERERVAELLTLESEPAVKLLEESAYRELILRQRINEAAQSVMLAYARDGDLDQLGALFGVQRLVVDPGQPDAIPPVPPTLQSNAEMRRRIQLSLFGLSVAGPEGAYIYHALSASGSVKDASATSPQPQDIKALVLSILNTHDAPSALVDAMNTALEEAAWPGEVKVTVLARDDDGTASTALVDTVNAAISADDVRPLTDYVTVQPAEIITYTIAATLYTDPGPDPTVVINDAQRAAEQYATQQHKLGRDVTLSGIYAALHRPGVQRVELISPTATLVINRQQAAYCTAITLINGGVDV